MAEILESRDATVARRPGDTSVRYGFGSIPSFPLREYVHLAQLGESLGFDVMWVPDQAFYRDPFVLLAAAALETRSLQLMLGVANPFTRHPVQVARAAATLAELSGGRFALGYGAGNRDELVERMGLEHRHIASRCREAVTLVRRLLRGEEVTHQSGWTTLHRVRLVTPAPDVPIYLGGRGEALLRAAGEIADGVIIGSMASAQAVGSALATVHEGAGAVGRTLANVDIVSWVGVQLTDRDPDAWRTLRPRVAHIIAGHRSTPEVLARLGMPLAHMMDVLAAYDAEGKGAAAEHVTLADVQLFTLIGSAADIRDRVRALSKVGVKQIGLLLQHPTAQEQAAFMEDFSKRVIQSH